MAHHGVKTMMRGKATWLATGLTIFILSVAVLKVEHGGLVVPSAACMALHRPIPLMPGFLLAVTCSLVAAADTPARV
eukprot:758105-Hanusia_phi.AAC.3